VFFANGAALVKPTPILQMKIGALIKMQVPNPPEVILVSHQLPIRLTLLSDRNVAQSLRAPLLWFSIMKGM
jgi:hypothetical protein